MRKSENPEISSWAPASRSMGPVLPEGSSWAPARRSLDPVLRQISHEDIADKLGRFFVPTAAVTSWMSPANTPESSHSWDSLRACTPPRDRNDDGGVPPLPSGALDSSVGALSWAGEASESMMPEVTLDTPPPEIITTEEERSKSWTRAESDDNVFYTEEEEGQQKDGEEQKKGKDILFQPSGSQKNTTDKDGLEPVLCSCMHCPDTKDFGGSGPRFRTDKQVWGKVTARQRTYFLYELPLFSPPKFRPPTGGAEAFSDSIVKWNNRRLPVFLVSS